jgi:hypothetical protein
MSRSVISYEIGFNATPALFAAATPALAPAAAPALAADATAPAVANAKARPVEDKYNDRLLKYIPAEAITLYLTLSALLSTQTGLPWWLGWAAFFVGIAATYYYLRSILNVSAGRQLTICCVAFVVWVFALGGPFKDLAWYRPIYGALLLPTYTFFIARVKTPPQPEG